MADDPTRYGANGDPWDIPLAWINPAKMKRPMTLVPIPGTMLEGVGEVGMQWGMFDQLFDQIHSGLIGKNGSEPNDWNRLRGKKRWRRFRQEAAIAFPDSPGILGFVTTLLADAASLGEQRNTLLHGKVSFMTRFRDGKREAAIIAETDKQRLDLNPDRLETLTHELRHLNGRLHLLREPKAKSFLTSQETQQIQDFWGSDRPSLPMPSRQPNPPRSSRG